MTTLPILAGGDPEQFAGAVAINDAGLIVGYSPSPTGRHAVLWSAAGVVQDLGTLGGSTSEAIDINSSGLVIGKSLIAGDAATHFFLWSTETGMQDLNTLLGEITSVVEINDAGQIIGTHIATGGASHAFLYTPGSGLRDLGTLGGATSAPTGLNNAGQVVGSSELADASTLKREAESQIRDEMATDRKYASLSQKVIAQAKTQAGRAKISQIERLVNKIPKEDAKLGGQRPEMVQSLNTAVQSQLFAARRLRLQRDQWLLRQTAYREYQRSVGASLLLLVKNQNSLEAIRTLEGPPPVLSPRPAPAAAGSARSRRRSRRRWPSTGRRRRPAPPPAPRAGGRTRAPRRRPRPSR